MTSEQKRMLERLPALAELFKELDMIEDVISEQGHFKRLEKLEERKGRILYEITKFSLSVSLGMTE